MFQKKVAQVLLERISLKDEKIENEKQSAFLSELQSNYNRKKADNLKLENEILEDKVFFLQRKIESYENLLSKPFEEIAKHNNNFAKTYEFQQELLADWMVSQKAFKQLAIEFGITLGKTPSDIVKEGLSKEIDVLNNVHNEEYYTNASQEEIIRPYIDKLKSKIQ